MSETAENIGKQISDELAGVVVEALLRAAVDYAANHGIAQDVLDEKIARAKAFAPPRRS